MNSLELHAWVLRNIGPLTAEGLDKQGELICAEDPRPFWEVSGYLDGIHKVTAMLLELVAELQDAEGPEVYRR